MNLLRVDFNHYLIPCTVPHKEIKAITLMKLENMQF